MHNSIQIGDSLKCEDDEIVEIDFARRNWQCTSDSDAICPGLGGLRVGCPAGSSTNVGGGAAANAAAAVMLLVSAVAAAAL